MCRRQMREEKICTSVIPSVIKKGEPGVAVHQGRAQHPKALKVSLCEMEEMFEIHGHRAGLCAKTKSVFVT